MTEATTTELGPVENTDRLRVIIRWAVLGAVLFWLLLPMIPLLIWSFAGRWQFPDLLPETWSLRAWSIALGPVSGVQNAILDSLIIAFAVTLISVLIALPAGRGNSGHIYPLRDSRHNSWRHPGSPFTDRALFRIGHGRRICQLQR